MEEVSTEPSTIVVTKRAKPRRLIVVNPDQVPAPAQVRTDTQSAIPEKSYSEKLTDCIEHDMRPLITEVIQRPCKEFIHVPTLFELPGVKEDLEAALRVKQMQMKEGLIGQIVIGNSPGWRDLKQGHESGLDCQKIDNSVIVEIKNKWNTVKGSDIKKSLLPTLAKYKKENPNTRCIWGVINPKPEVKKLREVIIHDGVEIEKIQGEELFKLVFTSDGVDYSPMVMKCIQEILLQG